MKDKAHNMQVLFWIFQAFVIFLALNTVAWAHIPEHIHFQGMLTDEKGELVSSGQHAIQFSIFNQPTLSPQMSPLWKERHLVTVENGIYTVLLGSHTSFFDPDQNSATNDGLSFSTSYYLDIIYNDRSLTTNGQLFPLTSVWTAFRSKTATGRLLTSVDQNHDIQPKDDFILVNGGVKISLPKAATCKDRIITIKKSDAAAKPVHIDCQEKDTIIAPQTGHSEKCPIDLTQPFEDITLISDGHRWWGMGQGKVMVEQQKMVDYANLQLNDALLTTDIKDGTLTHVDISPKAGITYHQLALDQSIQGDDIVNSAIQSSHIKDHTLSNIDIAANADIEYSKLHLDQSIQGKDIVDHAIQSSHIEDHTLSNIDIAANADIEYSKLALSGSIQYSDLSRNAVSTKTIKNGSILNEDISDDAQIQYHKLNLVRAIQHRDLQSKAVDSDIIQDKTIRNIDIADNARIQYKKLNLTDSIRTIDISDQSIIPSKLKHVNSMGTENQALVSDGQGGFQWKDVHLLDNVYVVGAGSAFQRIGDALSVVKTNNQPVLIKVGPGVFNEQVITRSNMCIEGSGQNITTIRFTGGNQGNATSATVVGYTNVELRDLTIISDASQAKHQNAIGLFNPSSVTIRHVTIKAYGGTAYNYGIYNDRSIPVILRTTVSVRSTVTEESWNYGIYNEFSDAHIENVDIQAWGGDRTFGIANKSSFPVIFHTRVTSSAGVMKNRGIWNESSSPRISHSEVIVSGVCHDNYGIENYNNSSPIIKNSMIKAVGLTSYGLYQWGSSQDSIKIYSSNISGETQSIYGNAAKFLLTNSQIEGELTGDMTCLSSFDQNFLPLDRNCQPEE
ncbi:MAG: hypothetical protein HQK75_18005 [Candidatus Magnetomorum sp.]|nr:hypothetical protein [Candidatus Magnetomorum sp.]